MDSEIKSERSVLRSLVIDICHCIPRVTNVLANTAMVWAQKICAYVQSECQEFSDIQGDSTAVGQHTDPAFIAYIKGEDPDPDAHFQQTAPENVESRHLKKTTREKSNKKACKVKKHTSTYQKRREVRSKPDLRMKPPPVEELVFRRKKRFNSTEKVSPGSTEPPRRESSGERIFTGDHQSHHCYENYTQDSASHDSRVMSMKILSDNSQVAAEKSTNHLRFLGILLVVVANALVRVVEKLCTYVQHEWTEFNNIYGHDSADVPYTEPAFIAYLKGEGTAPYISYPHVTFDV